MVCEERMGGLLQPGQGKYRSSPGEAYLQPTADGLFRAERDLGKDSKHCEVTRGMINTYEVPGKI